jgi:hypothetical protein
MLNKILTIAFCLMIISACTKDYKIVKENNVKNDFETNKLLAPGIHGFYDDSNNLFHGFKIILE